MIQRSKILQLMSMGLFIAMFLCLAHGQDAAPQWVNTGWREAQYTAAEWYTGFAQNTLAPGIGISEAIKRLERDAQNKLVESIVVRITGASTVESKNVRVNQGGEAKSKSSVDYQQVIQATSSAEVAKMDVRSYHDKSTNTIYAFATVKKSDLVNHYASQIEAALSEAQRNFDMARQFSELGKGKETFEALNASKRHIDSIAPYRSLLMVVDPEKGIERSQGSRVNDMVKAIAAARMEARNAMAVYVTGTENMHGETVDVIVSGLLTLFSENDYGVAKREQDAGYIISIEANICNSRPGDHFQYANACVKVTINNTKTGELESVTNITGPKVGGRDKRNAADKAFKAAIPKVWEDVIGRVGTN